MNWLNDKNPELSLVDTFLIYFAQTQGNYIMETTSEQKGLI